MKKIKHEYDHFFFFNDTATTEIYTLSLHDALPISAGVLGVAHRAAVRQLGGRRIAGRARRHDRDRPGRGPGPADGLEDRKSTRLNSSHANISYAVFCLKKKKRTTFHTCLFLFLSPT